MMECSLVFASSRFLLWGYQCHCQTRVFVVIVLEGFGRRKFGYRVVGEEAALAGFAPLRGLKRCADFRPRSMAVNCLVYKEQGLSHQAGKQGNQGRKVYQLVDTISLAFK
jgi:hypothetical protein